MVTEKPFSMLFISFDLHCDDRVLNAFLSFRNISSDN